MNSYEKKMILNDIFEDLLSENPLGLENLKIYLEKHEFFDWKLVYSYENYIERISFRNKRLCFIGTWVVSQICLNLYQDSLIFILKRFYEGGDQETQLEIIKALNSICFVNKEYLNIIQKTFSIEDIIENFDLEDIKEILIFYSKFEYSLKVLEKFMKVISVLIDSENFEYALKVLFELTSRNPLTLSYFTTSLLKKILDFLNQNSETQLLCLKILGNFVLNYENSFIKLVPLNIFSILLPILQKNNSASTKEIL